MRVFGTGLKGLLAHAAEQPCVICGGSPDRVALFVAEGAAAEQLGAKPGHTRLVPYSICNQHPITTETAETVERLLEPRIARTTPLVMSATVAANTTFVDEE